MDAKLDRMIAGQDRIVDRLERIVQHGPIAGTDRPVRRGQAPRRGRRIGLRAGAAGMKAVMVRVLGGARRGGQHMIEANTGAGGT